MYIYIYIYSSISHINAFNHSSVPLVHLILSLDEVYLPSNLWLRRSPSGLLVSQAPDESSVEKMTKIHGTAWKLPKKHVPAAWTFFGVSQKQV